MVVVLSIIVCIAAFYVVSRDINDYINILSGIVAVISSILSVTLIIFVIVAHIGVSGTIRSMEEEYKALVFKAQSEAVRDEFGLLNKEFIDEVQEWNMDIASGQEWQHDFWVGILYPPIYDEFRTIDLESMEFRK